MPRARLVEAFARAVEQLAREARLHPDLIEEAVRLSVSSPDTS
jgi:hypothetical protein